MISQDGVIGIEDPRELLFLDMYESYEKGISPTEWRQNQSADFRFIKQMKMAKNQKQISIQNKNQLMKEMGIL